jgi:hypothetical protein
MTNETFIANESRCCEDLSKLKEHISSVQPISSDGKARRSLCVERTATTSVQNATSPCIGSQLWAGAMAASLTTMILSCWDSVEATLK